MNFKDKIALADVSKEEQVQKMFDEISSRYGKLDYLVNNAGTNVDETIENSKMENYMKVVNTNFIGKMLCIKHSTECAALELSDYNIRVNTVSPGFIPTPLSLAGWTKEQIEEKQKTNPRHRLGKVEDMANTVIFLLSDKADFINGGSCLLR